MLCIFFKYFKHQVSALWLISLHSIFSLLMLNISNAASSKYKWVQQLSQKEHRKMGHVAVFLLTHLVFSFEQLSELFLSVCIALGTWPPHPQSVICQYIPPAFWGNGRPSCGGISSHPVWAYRSRCVRTVDSSQDRWAETCHKSCTAFQLWLSFYRKFNRIVLLQNITLEFTMA